jgi:hypothetical protein
MLEITNSQRFSKQQQGANRRQKPLPWEAELDVVMALACCQIFRYRRSSLFPSMDSLVEDAKAGRFTCTEYALDDANRTKAVECFPESSMGGRERKKVSSVEDLNVPDLRLFR